MQSSRMNSEKLRLSAASHSAPLSPPGELGLRPRCDSRSVAVDKAEATELRLGLALASATEDQARSRADPAAQDEAEAERPCRRHGKVRTKLCADVRRLADALAQSLRRFGQLLALGFDLAPNVFERPGVSTGRHRSSVPPS